MLCQVGYSIPLRKPYLEINPNPICCCSMDATCCFNPHDVLSLSSVDVLLKAVGDTPIMKTKKWAMEKGRTIQSLSEFIVKFLKLDPNEQLVRTEFISLPILQCPNVVNMALSLFLIHVYCCTLFSSFMSTNRFLHRLTRKSACYSKWVLEIEPLFIHIVIRYVSFVRMLSYDALIVPVSVPVMDSQSIAFQ